MTQPSPRRILPRHLEPGVMCPIFDATCSVNLIVTAMRHAEVPIVGAFGGVWRVFGHQWMPIGAL